MDGQPDAHLCSPGGQVKLRGGGVVEYDWLVLAMGSSTSFFDIPGVRELTFPFCDYKDAMKVLGLQHTLCLPPQHPFH